METTLSITIEFLQIFAALAVLMGLCLALGFAFGKLARPDGLRAANREVEQRKRVKAYSPLTNESKLLATTSPPKNQPHRSQHSQKRWSA
jgi:hypothetical protein